MRRLAVTFALILAAVPALAGTPQIRGFWVDGFSEGIKTPAQIEQLLARVRQANCNAVFAQVCKSADAYYLSRYDPWASDDPQHFDALVALIEKAHACRPRIAVHAWINTCAVGKARGNPMHVTALHPDWLTLSDTGANYDGEASKIDPGNPEAADWTFRVVMDVLRHYDVDGIHLDFIRYGGAKWGYNPANVARFDARFHRTGKPDPKDPAWQQWRRDQVTALVRKIYVTAAELKPRVVISAATVAWGKGPSDEAEWREKSAPMTRTFQDWCAWMREGILDLNCPMTYFSERRHPDWFARWTDWAKDHAYGRAVAPGLGVWMNTTGDTLRQVSRALLASRHGSRPRGVLLYSYAGTNVGDDGRERQYDDAFYSALSTPSAGDARPPFADAASVPEFGWKAHPTTGYVCGVVLRAADLRPVDGALVRVTSAHATRRVRTDGTGFWAAANLPPGAYRVRVTTGGASERAARVRCSAGRVARVTTFCGKAGAARLASAAGIARAALGERVLVESARVTGGTDTFPGEIYVADGTTGLSLRVHLAAEPVLAFQPGDVVAIEGTAAEQDGARCIDAASARLVDIDADAPAPASWSGVVMALHGDHCTVSGEQPFDLVLAPMKAPGVEAAVATPAAPAAGSRVEVTGVATRARSEDGAPIVRVRPLGPDALTVSSVAASALLKAAAWLVAAALAGALWLSVRRAGPHERRRSA